LEISWIEPLACGERRDVASVVHEGEWLRANDKPTRVSAARADMKKPTIPLRARSHQR
jgi:hypothetical protein